MTSTRTWRHRVWWYSVGVIGLRRRDVLVSSFPKSGNTWVRFFLANLLSLREWNGETVDFDILDSRMIEFGKSNLIAAPTPATLPRFVKTHLPNSPVFNGRKAIFIVRDPRDVMASFFSYEGNKTQPRISGTFSEFLRHPRFGLPGWVKHTSSWLNRATVVLRYEDMRADAESSFQAILDGLGIDATPEEVAEATRRASQKHVQAVEQAHGISRPERFREGFQFSRDGSVGRGVSLFNEAELSRLDDLLEQAGIDMYRTRS